MRQGRGRDSQTIVSEQLRPRDAVPCERALAVAAHNELFPLLHDSIGEAPLEVRRSNLSLGEQEFATVVEFHRAILEGLERRDPLAAATAVDAHLAHAETAWREVTAQQGAIAAARVPGSGGATPPLE